MTRMTAAFPVIVATASLTLVLAPASQADPIQVTYSTAGVVGEVSLDGAPVINWPSNLGPSGIEGTPVISFQGISNGTLTTGQPFALGQFVVGSMPSGMSTTYEHVPFQIAFTEHTVGGAVVPSNGTPLILDGFLNGTLTAGASPQLNLNFDTFSFNPEQGPPFPTNIVPSRTGDFTSYLSVITGDDINVPIQAELNLVHSAPEPSTIIIFGVVGFALARYRWRRSQASNP